MGMLWTVVAASIATTLLVSKSILIAFTRDPNGSYAYSIVSTTFVAELVKMAVSLVLLWRQKSDSSIDAEHTRLILPAHETIHFAVPALIYAVNNNMVFLILHYLDPTSFQIAQNLKILTTAILFRLILSRPLSGRKWVALLLLMVGTAVSQLPSSPTVSSSFSSEWAIGFGINALHCTLSGFAGVYTEYAMKRRRKQSIHVQNIHQYVYGGLVNLMSLVGSGTVGLGLFEGYSGGTWVIVGISALYGLTVSSLLKYSNNIVKVYTTSVAMLLTLLLSIQLFGQEITVPLIVGIVLVSLSIYIYNVSRVPAAAQKKDEIHV